MQVFLDTYATRGIRPALAREVLSTYSEPRFLAATADTNTRILVAELVGHLVGFAQITLGAGHELAPAGTQSELLRLYVQEPFTGQQIGTRLLNASEELSANTGASVLWLMPWVHNIRPLNFYTRRGYQDYGLTYFKLGVTRHARRFPSTRINSGDHP